MTLVDSSELRSTVIERVSVVRSTVSFVGTQTITWLRMEGSASRIGGITGNPCQAGVLFDCVRLVHPVQMRAASMIGTRNLIVIAAERPSSGTAGLWRPTCQPRRLTAVAWSVWLDNVVATYRPEEYM